MSAATGPHVLVMAKSPVAGRVKTRLCPPCSPAESAEVAGAALADTLESVAACHAGRKILALDGPPGTWVPPGIEVIGQRGDTFADRLANAWAAAGAPGVQIGMDTPQVGPHQLDRVLAALDGPPNRALLGWAVDGGWWVIGWNARRLDPAAVFGGIAMSTAMTGRLQARRLGSLGCDLVDAGRQRDIDTAADLAAVAALAPATRTAAVARRLGLATLVA